MSLVDYASSSDDDDELPEEKVAEGRGFESQPAVGAQARETAPEPSLATENLPTTQMDVLPSNRPSKIVSLQLPDVSLLLNSPSISSSSSSVSGTDHMSWVGAANASVKRDSTGPPSSSRRSKLPKGSSLVHTKDVPDTSSGVLVPPQLRGRSNVVTEDVGKLFVKRPAASPSQ